MSNAIVLMDSYAEFISEDKVQSQHLPLLRILMVVCLQVDAVYLQIWGLLSFEDILALHRKLISRTTGTMISEENADAFRTIMFEHSSSANCCYSPIEHHHLPVIEREVDSLFVNHGDILSKDIDEHDKEDGYCAYLALVCD